jgi:hypothetical protein
VANRKYAREVKAELPNDERIATQPGLHKADSKAGSIKISLFFIRKQARPLLVIFAYKFRVMIKTGNPIISIYTEWTPNPETMKFGKQTFIPEKH